MASSLTDFSARVIVSLAGEPGDEKVGAALAEFGAVESVQRWLRDDSTLAISRGIKRIVESNAVSDAMTTINAVAGRFITPSDAEWPAQLNDLDIAAPVGLWVSGIGNLKELSARSLAVVGARASTSYGERIASDIASACAGRHVAVVSGGAYGIDAASHRGALAAHGSTLAVLACGVDVAYPAAHKALLDRIKESGLVISEAAPGAGPLKHRFLTRNRLIAGLSQATVIVEAALRSGALSTTNWAGALGRKVWGVPGPMTSATSAGVHQGIKESGFTIMRDVNDPLEGYAQPVARQLSVSEIEIHRALALGPRTTAHIMATCGPHADIHQILGTLTMMEMRGDVRHVGDLWREA